MIKNNDIVRKNSKKTKKHFSFREGWNHFWDPLVNQIARIEAAYRRAEQRHRRICDKIQKVIQRIAGPRPKKNREYQAIAVEGDYQWSFFVEKQGFIYSWSTSSLSSSIPKKLDLGNCLLKLSRQQIKSKWSQCLADLLDEAIVRHLQKEYPKLQHSDIGTVFELHINYRKYLYTFGYSEYGNLDFNKLHWAENNVTKMIHLHHANS